MASGDDHDSTDPELLRQLDAAAASDDPVSATFTLRSGELEGVYSAEQASTVAKQVLQRAERGARRSAKDVTMFPHIQSFAVEGPAALIRKLLEQPEIESATANVQSQDLMIRPVDVKPTTPTRASRGKSRKAPAPRRRRS